MASVEIDCENPVRLKNLTGFFLLGGTMMKDAMKNCNVCLGQYGQWRSHCPYCGAGAGHVIIRAQDAVSTEQVIRVILFRIGASVDGADDDWGLDRIPQSWYT